jgi:hypothetical protein
MVTVSELKWCETIESGECPCCGRVRPLGVLNVGWFDEHDQEIGARCIDCYFGPPCEYWDRCPKCGEHYAGYACNSGGWVGEKPNRTPVCKADLKGGEQGV